MKIASLLLLVFLATSCGGSSNDSSDSCDSSSTQTCLFNVSEGLYDDEGPLPNETATFDTNLVLVNFSANDQDKIIEATELIKKVVASEEFRDGILNHTYNGQKTFVDNGGLTNSQIYHRFLAGAEKLTPATNNAIDAELELYFETSTVVGYTNPTTKRIWMNTKYFNNYSAAQVAGNLVHEWMHKLGFGHSSSSTPSRPYSVPYAVGYLMGRLAKQNL
jgi:hypothetical protein